jgi:hypothetical protein
MDEYEADTSPGDPQSLCSVAGSRDITWTAKFASPNQAMGVLRYLYTKFYCRKERLQDTEQFLLFCAIDYLGTFKSRNNLEILQSLKWLAIARVTEIYLQFRDSTPAGWAQNQLRLVLPVFAYSPRSFLGIRGKWDPTSFLRKTNLRLRKNPPPQRYIGVGYRDKGTCSVPHIDGSPGWKEVAMAANLSPDLAIEAERKLRSLSLIPRYRAFTLET